APTSYFAAVFRGVFRQQRVVSQGNVSGVSTQRTEGPLVTDFQASTLHQMYDLAHRRFDFITANPSPSSIRAAPNQSLSLRQPEGASGDERWDKSSEYPSYPNK